MNVIEKYAEGLSRTFEIVVPARELETRLINKIEEIRPETHLKGFRPGKTPASHLRKVFGAAILGDILQELVPQTTQDTLSERNIRPASQPTVDVKSDAEDVFNNGSDFSFEINLEIMPEFDAIDPTTLELVRQVCRVTDEHIDEALADMAKLALSYETKNGKAEDGDRLVIDYTCFADGEILQKSSTEGFDVILGENSAFLPELEDQLIGASAGDKLDVRMTIPKHYPNEDMAGKDVIFATTVKEVQSVCKTGIDNSLAESMGMSDLEELKESLTRNLEVERAEASRSKLKRALLDRLDAEHDQIMLPEKMVEQEFEQIWREVRYAIDNGQLDEEDSGKSENKLKAVYHKIAARRVRVGLVLAEIGRKANVNVTQEELTRAMNQTAARFQGGKREMVEFYRNNPGAMEVLRAPIYEEKVVNYILELAKVTDEEVDPGTLFAEDEDINI